MNETPNQTVKPRKSYSFEAIPEDDATQDELNRRLRKPGETRDSSANGNNADHCKSDCTSTEPEKS